MPCATALPPIRRCSVRPSACRSCSRTMPTSTSRVIGTRIDRRAGRGTATPSGTSGEITIFTSANDFATDLSAVKQQLARGHAHCGATPTDCARRAATRGAQGGIRALAAARRRGMPRRLAGVVAQDRHQRIRGPVAKVEGARRRGCRPPGPLRQPGCGRDAWHRGAERACRHQRRAGEDHAAWQCQEHRRSAPAARIGGRSQARRLAHRHLRDAGSQPPGQRPRGRLAGAAPRARGWSRAASTGRSSPPATAASRSLPASAGRSSARRSRCSSRSSSACRSASRRRSTSRSSRRRTALTELIEVNINNLAAVPSIVFGLLGLAVFLNFVGLPRSAPLVGGLVLALLVLPTIIIASRAALKAVPPSIKEAAFGVGASHQQAIFHHVLPLAMPGIMTGTIIGMAHALGETAPLLMIGMVAFIVEVPTRPHRRRDGAAGADLSVVGPARNRLPGEDRGRDHGSAGLFVRDEWGCDLSAQAIRAQVVTRRGVRFMDTMVMNVEHAGGDQAASVRAPRRFSRAMSTSTTARSMR